MAVANIDIFEVRKTIYTALNVAGLQALIGTPIRMYERVPRSQSVFPFVRWTTVGDVPRQGVMSGNPDWFRQELHRFSVFDTATSQNTTAAIIKVIQDIMDALSNTAVSTVGYITHCVPRTSFINWVADEGSWMGVTDYDLTITR